MNNGINFADIGQTFIDKAEALLNKTYLDDLNSMPIVNLLDSEDGYDRIKLIKVESIIYDEASEFDYKIKTLLNSFANDTVTISVLFRKRYEKLDVYFGLRENSDANVNGKSKDKIDGFSSLIKSVFCGSKVKDIGKSFTEVENEIVKQTDFGEECSITMGYITPSPRVDDFNDIASILEQKGDFSILLICENIKNSEITDRINGFGAIKDQLSELSKKQVSWQNGDTETDTEGTTKTLSESITKGFIQSMGLNKASSSSNSISSSITKTITNSTPNTKNGDTSIAGGVLRGIAGALSFIPVYGTIASAILGGIGGGLSGAGISTTDSSSTSESTTEGKSSTTGESTGFTSTTTISRHKTKGKSEAEAKSHAKSHTASNGETVERINSRALNLINRIDEICKNYDSSRNIGLWNLGVYVIGKQNETKKVWNSIKGFAGSENSCYDFCHSTSTDDDFGGMHKERVLQLLKWIRRFENPVFASYGRDESENKIIDLFNTSTSTINTNQLSHIFTLPKKSLPNFEVKEIPSFGRNALYRMNHSDDVLLGSVLNCETIEEDNRITLSLSELNRHTMIVGSTRSGKTNSVKLIISDVLKHKKPILIFDPKTDENSYIDIKNGNFKIYGDSSIKNREYNTNSLKINFFKYDKTKYAYTEERADIYNQIEALRPIFCLMWSSAGGANISETWPIFRKALFKCYIEAEKNDKFPTPIYLREVFEWMVNKGEFGYSEYIFNCLSYVRSRIDDLLIIPYFDEEGMDLKEIFESNCIINLKDYSEKDQILITGYLLNELQDYLINKPGEKYTGNLEYLTIFEEAHKIFKCSKNSSLDESVEKIAEKVTTMASLGEGFVYVDQSPSLLHQYIQNNTNNKISFNLINPDDVEFMARSMGIDDDKKKRYMTKLGVGMGLVKTNELLDEVLCMFEEVI